MKNYDYDEQGVFLFSVGPCEERKVPRSGFWRLANPHVFALAIGVPQSHDVDDGWVRCRLCHFDLEVNLRGQSSWKAHWHTSEHFTREFQYRLEKRLPLYAGNYQLTNPGKGKKVDLVDPASIPGDELRSTRSGVYMEPYDRLSLAERQARDRS